MLHAKQRKAAAEKMQAVGLPGNEDEKYVKPRGTSTPDEIATEKVEITMKKKYAEDPTLQKKASGRVAESEFQLDDMLPTAPLKKVAVLVGTAGMKKLMPLVIKRYALKDAYDKASGAAKRKAYDAMFDVHKEVEKITHELARQGAKDPKDAGTRMLQINEEIGEQLEKHMPMLERVHKQKYELTGTYPETKAEVQAVLRRKVDELMKTGKSVKKTHAGSPGAKAAGQRTKDRAAAARKLKTKANAEGDR